ncbi:hypothetical protein CDIK_2090 [Cucumispora dikerogammari]|nr:hypothetical protein CDIK_2090 [Cucumispora dikerogammari]
MHALATNTICTYNNYLSVIISPITYNKVLIQTINKERLEINTKQLLSLKENKLISIPINKDSTIEEVNNELIKVSNIYLIHKRVNNLSEETKYLENDFERFKRNLRLKVEMEVIKYNI